MLGRVRMAGTREWNTQVWNSSVIHLIFNWNILQHFKEQNLVYQTWFVRMLNSFKTLLINKIVWWICLFWRKKKSIMLGHIYFGLRLEFDFYFYFSSLVNGCWTLVLFVCLFLVFFFFDGGVGHFLMEHLEEFWYHFYEK